LLTILKVFRGVEVYSSLFWVVASSQVWLQ